MARTAPITASFTDSAFSITEFIFWETQYYNIQLTVLDMLDMGQWLFDLWLLDFMCCFINCTYPLEGTQG